MPQVLGVRDIASLDPSFAWIKVFSTVQSKKYFELRDHLRTIPHSTLDRPEFAGMKSEAQKQIQSALHSLIGGSSNLEEIQALAEALSVVSSEKSIVGKFCLDLLATMSMSAVPGNGMNLDYLVNFLNAIRTVMALSGGRDADVNAQIVELEELYFAPSLWESADVANGPVGALRKSVSDALSDLQRVSSAAESRKHLAHYFGRRLVETWKSETDARLAEFPCDALTVDAANLVIEELMSSSEAIHECITSETDGFSSHDGGDRDDAFRCAQYIGSRLLTSALNTDSLLPSQIKDRLIGRLGVMALISACDEAAGAGILSTAYSSETLSELVELTESKLRSLTARVLICGPSACSGSDSPNSPKNERNEMSIASFAPFVGGRMNGVFLESLFLSKRLVDAICTIAAFVVNSQENISQNLIQQLVLEALFQCHCFAESDLDKEFMKRVLALVGRENSNCTFDAELSSSDQFSINELQAIANRAAVNDLCNETFSRLSSVFSVLGFSNVVSKSVQQSGTKSQFLCHIPSNWTPQLV